MAGRFTALVNTLSSTAARATEGATILGGMINIYGISSDNKEIRITLQGSSTSRYLTDQPTLIFLSYVDGNSGNTIHTLQTRERILPWPEGLPLSRRLIPFTKPFPDISPAKCTGTWTVSSKNITQGSFTQIPYLSRLPPAAAGDSLYVSIDGLRWGPPSTQATAGLGKLLEAGSSRDGSRTVALSMPRLVAPGLYRLNYPAGVCFGEYSPDRQTPLVSDTAGTIFVLENHAINRRIRGNFQFPAVDPAGGTAAAQLSLGYFSLAY